MRQRLLVTLLLTLSFLTYSKAQTWYDSAQVRIDSLRKGNFTLKIVDGDGNGVQDSIKVIHRKHEFPWGTAIDLNYNGGNNYTAPQPVTAPADSEVYRTERWASSLTYYLPTVKDKYYKITLKLSENYFSSANSRLFDVYIDGQRVMQNVDKYAIAKGQYKGFDTTVNAKALGNNIKLEFLATKDNVAIMGIVLSDSSSTPVLRLNCTANNITTKDGNLYLSDLPYLDKSSPNDRWVKSVMLKYCNYGVCGNQFKWSGIEPNHLQLNYAPFENTKSWFDMVGWDMRAHTILWGGNNSTDYHCIPQWVMALSTNPKAMYDTCKMRVYREVTRYKGIVKEYDVLNEPTHANYLQGIVGDSINWNCFKWAHDADPNARLFINDYNIIEWQDQTDNFVNLVKKMLQHGAPITGIGSQCHIGSSVDIINYKKRFDQLGQFGLPIKVTEFDMNASSVSQQVQAVETSKMMRLAFSHPAIEGFIFWGLTNPGWATGVENLINEDRTSRIVADSVYRLIHEVWSTRLTGTTDATGTYSFKGYYGDYDVLLKVNGTWKKVTATCKKANMNTVIELKEGDGIAVSPVLKKASIKAPTTIELTFDKPMANPANEIRNYMVFDTLTNSIISATLKSGDSTTIVLKTKAALLTTKSQIPVTYMPGNQTSSDGGLLEQVGPVYLKGYLASYASSKTTSDGRRIAIRFYKKLADTTVNLSNFSVKVNNTGNAITNAALSSSLDTLYLTLANRVVKTTDVITVTYQLNALLTTDGYFVSGFSAKPVTNSIVAPTCTAAATSTNGKLVALVFNRPLADTSVYSSNFSVKVNNTVNAITKATVSATKDTIFLTLSNQIVKSSDAVIVSYTAGLLKSADSLFVASISNKTVTNKVLVPTFVSAASGTDGTTIQLGFTQVLADPTGQESAFTVTVNSQNAEVASAALLQSDAKNIVLTLTSGFYKGDTVTVAYTPGTLLSAIEVPAPAFSSKVTNNSTNLHSDVKDATGSLIRCYPNPFSNEILVSNPSTYTTITISDMNGKKLIQKRLNPSGKTSVNTSSLSSGVYTITLSDNTNHTILKMLKL